MLNEVACDKIACELTDAKPSSTCGSVMDLVQLCIDRPRVNYDSLKWLDIIVSQL